MLAVDAYLRMSREESERANRNGIDVVDEDGNVPPRCDGCRCVVVAWSPWFDAGAIERPNGLFFCGNCAAERNLEPPEREVWTRYEALRRPKEAE